MNARDFERLSIQVLGTTVGWQARIARRLDVNRRTVVRWLAADAVPPWAEAKLAALIGAGDATAPWPRDEWVIGDAVTTDGRRREYIVHLEPPRFAARVVTIDDDGEPEADELPVDLSGLVYKADAGTLLAEVAWIDPEPPADQIGALMEAAAAALDEQSERDAS